MRIFVSIGVKRLKYQNTQILDLRYQKIRMMQNDCRKSTQEVSKNDMLGKNYEDDSICLRKENPVCWETSICFTGKIDSQSKRISVSLRETRRLPFVSLVTMFKVIKDDITNYHPGDSLW